MWLFVGIISLAVPLQTHLSQLLTQLYSHPAWISRSVEVIQGYLIANYGHIHWILAF